MTKFFALLLFFYFLVTPVTEAHVQGKSIITINGKNTLVIPDALDSQNALERDQAADTYALEQPLRFSIDTTSFPTSQGLLRKSNVNWDFGDGEKQVLPNGWQITHTYHKKGTFLIIISVDYRPAGFLNSTPQILQTVVMPVGITRSSPPTPRYPGKWLVVIFVVFAGMILFFWRRNYKKILTKKIKR